MSDYTTEQNIENYLLTDIADSFSGNIDRWINAVEQYIDKQTNRTFGTSNSASTRVYDGDDTDTLIIDDAHEIVSVTRDIDDSALGSDEWYSLPANDKPYTAIELDKKVFPEDTQNITVEAKWGYGEVPDDIQLAATVLVAGIVNVAHDSDGEVKKESFGDYSVTYRSESHWADYKRAEDIIKSYKRHSF